MPATKSSTASKKKSTSALQKPVQISETLAAVVGRGPMPRTEVTKKLWDYIKKHNLQSKTNKRKIKADATLAKVFGISIDREIDMLEMPGKVSKHLS